MTTTSSSHPMANNHNRKDCWNHQWGTSFESKHWFSLNACGIGGMTCSFSIHLYAFVVIYKKLISTSLPSSSLFPFVVFLFLYLPISLLAVISLYMASTTDPGAVPLGARPLITVKPSAGGVTTDDQASKTSKKQRAIRRCHKCNDNYKPPRAHHDSVTGRCIVKMDHFCPWVCNAIGALNHKFFVLFIFYTLLTCLLSLFLLLIRAIQCGFYSGNTSSDDDDGLSEGASRMLRGFLETKSLRPDNQASMSSGFSFQKNSGPVEQEEQEFFVAGMQQEEDQNGIQVCADFYSSKAILFLVIFSVTFFIFTVCMLLEQLEAIQTNTGKIARMKMRVGASGSTEFARVTEQFNEMFGGDSPRVTWHWFLPIPVRFPRGMKKVVLGYEWDESFERAPYQETNVVHRSHSNSTDSSSNNNKDTMTTATDTIGNPDTSTTEHTHPQSLLASSSSSSPAAAPTFDPENSDDFVEEQRYSSRIKKSAPPKKSVELQTVKRRTNSRDRKQDPSGNHLNSSGSRDLEIV